MPEAAQDRDGGVEVSLGAKGIVELELISSGEKWGRGPAKDVHSSLEAQVDSPTWHLVQALNTLIAKDGHTPVVEGFFEKVKPLEPWQVQIIREHAAKDLGSYGDASIGRAALGARQELGGFADPARVAADDQHRGAGCRL